MGACFQCVVSPIINLPSLHARKKVSQHQKDPKGSKKAFTIFLHRQQIQARSGPPVVWSLDVSSSSRPFVSDVALMAHITGSGKFRSSELSIRDEPRTDADLVFGVDCSEKMLHHLSCVCFLFPKWGEGFPQQSASAKFFLEW